MQYAPVAIPTLNRKKHLSRCLESLANNTGAEFTEVYVSVDYPPTEHYMKGYLEVRDYLNSFDSSCFKAFNVIYQEKNLGAKANFHFLQTLMRQKADRYIFSEDDNEFSCNFLEYINKGLEIYKDNENVIAICGAKDTQWINENPDVNFAKLLPAYGYGMWLDKDERLKEKAISLLLDKKTLDLKKMIDLIKKNRTLFNIYICNVLCTNKGLFWYDNEIYWCDSVKGIYMHLTDAVCVVPVKAKSRTWGNDGTGVNMRVRDINVDEKWPLDENKKFEYINIKNMRFNEKNYKIGSKYLRTVDSFLKFLIALCLYFLLLILNRDRRYILKLRELLKR